MKIIVDVAYGKSFSRTALVAFRHWADARPLFTRVVDGPAGAPYVPGRFHLRELPCLREALASVSARK